MGSLLRTGWIKTWPAQKLLVRVKFTGYPYSYVCERSPLKYTQTYVCQNSYMGTHTVPDSILVFCERSLSQFVSVNSSFVIIVFMGVFVRALTKPHVRCPGLCTVLSGTLNPTHSFTSLLGLCVGKSRPVDWRIVTTAIAFQIIFVQPLRRHKLRWHHMCF